MSSPEILQPDYDAINEQFLSEHFNESNLYYNLLIDEQRRLGLDETSFQEVRATFTDEHVAKIKNALDAIANSEISIPGLGKNQQVREIIRDITIAKWGIGRLERGDTLKELAAKHNLTEGRVHMWANTGTKAVALLLFPELVGRKPSLWDKISHGDYTQVAVYKEVSAFRLNHHAYEKGAVTKFKHKNFPELHAVNETLLDDIKAEYGEDNVVTSWAKDAGFEVDEGDNSQKAKRLAGHIGVYVRTKVFDETKVS